MTAVRSTRIGAGSPIAQRTLRHPPTWRAMLAERGRTPTPLLLCTLPLRVILCRQAGEAQGSPQTFSWFAPTLSRPDRPASPRAHLCSAARSVCWQPTSSE